MRDNYSNIKFNSKAGLLSDPYWSDLEEAKLLGFLFLMLGYQTYKLMPSTIHRPLI